MQLYRQRVSLEQTLRLNEMFMAVLGHDLRNPVGALVTTATLLAMNQDPEVVKKSAERLALIGTRMGRMINDLLDLARSRLGGGIPMNANPTELSSLIRRVVEELRLVHGTRDVVVELPEQTIIGQWDEDRLAQLAVNLLANALEHGPRDRAVFTAMTCRERTAVLSVANHGEIAPDLLPRLFDPFRTGVDRGENPSEGLGLGLYIVQQIAEAHGGSIAVNSDAGMVTFTVRLPLEPNGSRSMLSRTLLPK